jgi:hypothetical protein
MDDMVATGALIAPSLNRALVPFPNVTLTALSDKVRNELWQLKPSKGEPKPQDIAAAVLFREILKPLADGLGPVGEIALGTVADELFLRSRR